MLSHVTSRGCSKAFIVCVLWHAWNYVRRLRSENSPVCFPFPEAVVKEWLVSAQSDCQDAFFAEDFFGGTPYAEDDPATHWTQATHFFTWWKNNIERKAKFGNLVKDAINVEQDSQRCTFCREVVSLAINIKNHFDRIVNQHPHQPIVQVQLTLPLPATRFTLSPCATQYTTLSFEQVMQINGSPPGSLPPPRGRGRPPAGSHSAHSHAHSTHTHGRHGVRERGAERERLPPVMEAAEGEEEEEDAEEEHMHMDVEQGDSPSHNLRQRRSPSSKAREMQQIDQQERLLLLQHAQRERARDENRARKLLKANNTCGRRHPYQRRSHSDEDEDYEPQSSEEESDGGYSSSENSDDSSRHRCKKRGRRGSKCHHNNRESFAHGYSSSSTRRELSDALRSTAFPHCSAMELSRKISSTSFTASASAPSQCSLQTSSSSSARQTSDRCKPALHEQRKHEVLMKRDKEFSRSSSSVSLAHSAPRSRSQSFSSLSDAYRAPKTTHVLQEMQAELGFHTAVEDPMDAFQPMFVFDLNNRSSASTTTHEETLLSNDNDQSYGDTFPSHLLPQHVLSHYPQSPYAVAYSVPYHFHGMFVSSANSSSPDQQQVHTAAEGSEMVRFASQHDLDSEKQQQASMDHDVHDDDFETARMLQAYLVDEEAADEI